MCFSEYLSNLDGVAEIINRYISLMQQKGGLLGWQGKLGLSREIFMVI
jgi:hypothetical protein